MKMQTLTCTPWNFIDEIWHRQISYKNNNHLRLSKDLIIVPPAPLSRPKPTLHSNCEINTIAMSYLLMLLNDQHFVFTGQI